jgi:zinc transport system substrate-binding protein
MTRLRLGILLGICLLIASGLLAGCAQKVSPGLKVVTGTSLIANIATDVGGDRVTVRNVIPPGLCPGQYDVKPGDIETLAQANVLIIHSWQQGQQDIKELTSAANNASLIIKTIELNDNWMAPPIQAEAVDKIAAALGEIDPANSAYYQERAEARKLAILAKGDEIQAELQAARISGVKVICSDMQTGFVTWAGFDVVATYGRPETLTAAKAAEIVTQAKAAGVALVIDNLQSGPEAGKSMARDIGAVQVTISNFPGGLENTETWEKAIDKNIELLLAALAQYQKMI